MYSKLIQIPNMYTLIPAERHLLTASGTLGRGGSIIEKSPTKHNPSMGKLTCKKTTLHDKTQLIYIFIHSHYQTCIL